ncbi:MAG: cupin domain-containing protein [Hyphomicrobiales bacterium]
MSLIGANAPEALGDGIRFSEFDLAGAKAPFEASCFIVAPGVTTDPDRHAVREIWFIASGAAEVYVDEQSYQVKAGTALLFQPQQVHRLDNSGTEPVRVFSVWWSP